MNAKKQVEDKVFNACENEIPDTKYCENLSQGKACKKIETCEIYKKWQKMESEGNTKPTKKLPEPISYIHD